MHFINIYKALRTKIRPSNAVKDEKFLKHKLKFNLFLQRSMDCERSLEPPRRSPDGDVVSDGAPGLCFGAERGENMYIYPCSRLNILSQLFFSRYSDYSTTTLLQSTPPPTILGLYIVSFQILRVIYSLLKKKKRYYVHLY